MNAYDIAILNTARGRKYSVNHARSMAGYKWLSDVAKKMIRGEYEDLILAAQLDEMETADFFAEIIVSGRGHLGMDDAGRFNVRYREFVSAVFADVFGVTFPPDLAAHGTWEQIDEWANANLAEDHQEALNIVWAAKGDIVPAALT